MCPLLLVCNFLASVSRVGVDRVQVGKYKGDFSRQPATLTHYEHRVKPEITSFPEGGKTLMAWTRERTCNTNSQALSQTMAGSTGQSHCSDNEKR